MPDFDEDQTTPEEMTQTGPLPDVLTAKQVAAYLQVSYKIIINLAKAGDVPAFMVAGQWRFLRSDLDRWLTVMSRKDYRGPALPDVPDDQEGG